jgi:hypothetical protein
MTTLKFQPWSNSTSKNEGGVSLDNRAVAFEAGDYLFSATINYPQLTPLKPSAVLNNASSVLAKTMSGQTTALSFLSYSEKLMAGAWRFLTYFGRDSMIATLLLEPVLSYGEGSATEAVIGAVLERINRTDGTVCHEETIGLVSSSSSVKLKLRVLIKYHTETTRLGPMPRRISRVPPWVAITRWYIP